MHEGLSGPLPEIGKAQDLRQIIDRTRETQAEQAKEVAEVTKVIREATQKQESFLNEQIHTLSDTRSKLGVTSKPGPVVNATTISGLILAGLAVAGVVLSQEQVDAMEVLLAAVVPVVVNMVAGYQARQRVTPVK